MTRPIRPYTVAELEPLLDIEFTNLSNDEVIALGLVAVEVIREWDANLAVHIVIGTDLVFAAKLKSTGPDNDPWLAAKAAAAVMFGEPSFLVKHRHLEAGTPFEELDGIDHDAVKAHGGAFPLRVAGDVVGTLTMSGEPDTIDHEAAVEAITRYLARL